MDCFLRQTEVRNLRGRRLFDIRSEAEKRKEKLLKNFDKWAFLSKISNLKNNAESASRERSKVLSIFKMVENSNKLSKRVALKNSKNKIANYLIKKARYDALNRIISKRPDPKIQILRKYFDRWADKIKDDKQKDFKKRLSADLLDSAANRIKKNLLRSSFNKLTRLPKRAEVVEKIVIQEKILEKEAQVKGVNPNLLSAGHLLENAILRLTYKYPLDAIDDKLVKNSRTQKLLKILNIKENYIKRIIKDYLNKWINKCKDKESNELIKKMIMKLLNTVLKKIKNRILSNKLNQWRNKVRPKGPVGDDIYKKSKGLNNLSKILKKSSSKMFGKDFLDNLNKKRSQRVYKNALLKIIDNYFNKDRNKLRSFLYKWKDKVRKLQIYDLKVKVLKNLGGKNDNNNRKLRLSKSIHKWLMNTNLEKIGEKESSKTLKKGKSDKKKYAALIMKILKRINNEIDRDTILRN